MAAVNQHVTYNELLPRILGPSMVNAYGLRLQTEGYYAGYDSNCPATIFNEFAAAAFRFGHSLIRPNLARMDGRYHGMNPHLQLRDGFFNSDMLYKPLMVDEIIRGLVAEPMEQLDPFVTNEITNHLFEDKKRSFSGLDLISLNIHRARDHGIPGYNSYRAVCNLKKAESFQELRTEIPDDVLQRLQKVG
jgi:peroxidase